MKFTTAKVLTGLSAAILLLGAPVAANAQLLKTTQINTGNLVSALNNISVELNDLEALNDLTVEDVQVVNVEDVLNDSNIEVLNQSLNKNEVEILNLQNVLNNNEVIKNALNKNNVAVDDVVAIDVLSGGDVVVFYQK